MEASPFEGINEFDLRLNILKSRCDLNEERMQALLSFRKILRLRFDSISRPFHFHSKAIQEIQGLFNRNQNRKDEFSDKKPYKLRKEELIDSITQIVISEYENSQSNQLKSTQGLVGKAIMVRYEEFIADEENEEAEREEFISQEEAAYTRIEELLNSIEKT